MTDASIRVIIVGADGDQVDLLREAITATGRFEIVLVTDTYPNSASMNIMLHLYGPHAFLFGVDEQEKAFQSRAELKELLSAVPAIGFGRTFSPEAMLELIRADFLDYVNLANGPLNLGTLADRLLDRLEQHPIRSEVAGQLYSFLPAKPGVGASTVALQSSAALSKESGKNVLLADLDLNNGLIAFMAKLEAVLSPQDLFDQAARFDEDVWKRMVLRKDDLHVFAAQIGDPDIHVEPSKIEAVIAFSLTLYKHVCVDLSGNMERYSRAVLSRSDRIFLVCTPETPALHLARHRIRLLRDLGVGDRVGVILNRWQRGRLFSLFDVEKMLGVPVLETIPNEYQSVHDALLNGSEVNVKSKLGQSFLKLATRMRDFVPNGERPKWGRLLENIPLPAGVVRRYSAEAPVAHTGDSLVNLKALLKK